MSYQRFSIICVVLCLIAVINAGYLTYHAYTLSETVSSFCDINNQFSCTNVLSDPASKVFGIPFPAIALVVYPVLMLLLVMIYRYRSMRSLIAVRWITLGGVLFNSYIVWVEATQIGSFCLLCLFCTAIIISLAIMSWRFSFR